jgi:hypothetical protein
LRLIISGASESISVGLEGSISGGL